MLPQERLAFDKACDWLADVKKIANINKSTSYQLKVIVEQDIGYITSDTLIAAAKYCGFRCVPDGPNSPNVRFNMSIKSLQAKQRHQNMKRSYS